MDVIALGYLALDEALQYADVISIRFVLRDLGDPEPPLSLQIVRDRLELDLQYYSTTDHPFVRDAVHAIKVAGKQVLKRPTLLIDAIASRSPQRRTRLVHRLTSARDR